MVKKSRFILFIAFFLIGGCSNDEEQSIQSQSNQEHVFKEQKRALDKAKGVELMLKNAAEKQRQSIAEQTK